MRSCEAIRLDHDLRLTRLAPKELEEIFRASV
jgi:hypothetical protein